MQYWGKVVGTVAGLATGRPLLGLLGLLLGHQFDRGFADRFSRLSSQRARIDKLPPAFLKPLFQTMGHIAKADGRVSEDEIRAARALMHRLGLGPADVRDAIGWFQSGKQNTYALQGSIRRLRRDAARSSELRRLFVHLLLEVALSKGSLHRRERSMLWQVCSELDIGRVELAQLEAMLRAQRGFRQSPEGNADAKRVSDAYQTLGLSPSASNAEIKKTYRRLTNRFHPDKLSGTNADAASIAEAERRTRDIRGAYDLLKVRRTIR